jgi:hypothetical protein
MNARLYRCKKTAAAHYHHARTTRVYSKKNDWRCFAFHVIFSPYLEAMFTVARTIVVAS